MKATWVVACSCALVLAVAILEVAPASAAPPRASGRVYANGVLWATFGTPTTISGAPEQSLDRLFKFPGTDLIPVGEASPGDRDYNGGRWDVRLVTFTGMEPTQFTSDDEVWYHASLGDLTISDTMGGFVCPLFAL